MECFIFEFSRNFPLALRSKWLPAFRHHKIRFLFASALTHPEALVPANQQQQHLQLDEDMEAFGGLANPASLSTAVPTDAPSAAAAAVTADASDGDGSDEDGEEDNGAKDSDEDETVYFLILFYLLISNG